MADLVIVNTSSLTRQGTPTVVPGKSREGIVRRVPWSAQETFFLLTTLRDLHVGKILEGTRQKNAILFKSVRVKMQMAGFTNKSWQQIRMRWKLLKSAYLKGKRRSNSDTGHSMSKYFDDVQAVLEGKSRNEDEPQVLPSLIVPKVEKPDEYQMELMEENLNESTFSVDELCVAHDQQSHHEAFNNNTDGNVQVSGPADAPNLQPKMQNFSVPTSKNSEQKILVSQILSHQRQLHESNQKWLSEQLEMQRKWQQQCFQQQMDVIQSTVQLVTTAFTKGMQQMLNTILLNAKTLTQRNCFKPQQHRSKKSDFQDDDSVSSNISDKDFP